MLNLLNTRLHEKLNKQGNRIGRESVFQTHLLRSTALLQVLQNWTEVNQRRAWEHRSQARDIIKTDWKRLRIKTRSCDNWKKLVCFKIRNRLRYMRSNLSFRTSIHDTTGAPLCLKLIRSLQNSISEGVSRWSTGPDSVDMQDQRR